MSPNDGQNSAIRNTRGQTWRSLVDELHKTTDIQRIQELVMLLEEAIFYRQQDLALNADKIDKQKLNREAKALKEALDLMLEMKTKKLGFPEIR